MYENLTDEQVHNAINMTATMVIYDLSVKLDIPSSKMVYDFYSSYICKALYDVDAKLWCFGPSFIEDEYLKEIEKKNK